LCVELDIGPNVVDDPDADETEDVVDDPDVDEVGVETANTKKYIPYMYTMRFLK